MTNSLQEAEDIRFGLADVDTRSIRAIREVLIATLNGYAVPDDTKARLLGIEEDALSLRMRRATLYGQKPPQRPVWMDPKPAKPASPDTSTASPTNT